MTFSGYQESLITWIRLWLQEDVGSGDVTTAVTVPQGHHSRAVIHAKEEGVLAGLPVAEQVFNTVDEKLTFQTIATEGQWLQKGDIIAEVEGSTHSLLTGERLALNLLQRMSGIATGTARYVKQIEGLPVRLVDTRKTTPGHRMLEKYAVRIGGGFNHRFGLYDAVMIKDNHIKAAGGILPAVQAARAAIPHTMTIEVETETLGQVEQALTSGADIIMLDNMDHQLIREAVAHIRSYSPHVKIEGSGNVSLETIRRLAETGIDIISVGRLTYSFDNLDISLDLGTKKKE